MHIFYRSSLLELNNSNVLIKYPEYYHVYEVKFIKNIFPFMTIEFHISFWDFNFLEAV